MRGRPIKRTLRRVPVPLRGVDQQPQTASIATHAKVIEVPLDASRERGVLHGHRQVSMATTPGGGDSNRSLQTRGPCLTPHTPSTTAGSSPVQREPQEVE